MVEEGDSVSEDLAEIFHDGGVFFRPDEVEFIQTVTGDGVEDGSFFSDDGCRADNGLDYAHFSKAFVFS